MNEKRRREKCEYLREHKRKKKEKAMMSKREKSERYYMGKEDVKVVAATLAPPSPYSTLPSVPSFVPSHMEEEVGVTSLPEYQVGDTALLEANTKGRGCNLFYISSFCIHSQMYATLLGLVS